ncbi:MAG: hypothetical protein KGD67_02515 [Candidatus Lokiarchaeota archaeon]|nr:hypothetical protein [Candidatus Lokiarchaeota archaeon]
MKKKAWTSLIISIIISGIILNIGINLQNFEEYHQNYPLGLSNSDSWSKIVKEGGWFYPPYCELVNGSLYLIGTLELGDYTNKYLYISKFNISGIKQWEHSIELGDNSRISYVFDNDNNLFVLNEYFSSNNISLIKVNSLGAILFSKEFNLDLHNHDVSLVLGDNNSLLIVGQYDQHPYPEKLFIMKFNNAGQFLWNTSFRVDYYFLPPYIVKDSGYNMYLFFRNNSIYQVAKINSSGAITWQMGLENYDHKFLVDFNDNLYIMGVKNYSTGYILKLNSTGNQIKEILLENFKTYGSEVWYLNDIFVFNRHSMSILCYDLNLEHKWNFSLSDYISPPFNLQSFLARDSHDNVYIVQNNRLGNINLVKISNTGEFLSRIIWGGFFVVEPGSLNIDFDNNIYFICNCEYSNVWGDQHRFTILVKNPVNGGNPPEPRRDLDIRDYFVFGVVGIACIISPIALLSILRSNKKRIG